MGLLTYPVLMAADILLYRADSVPVGDDQTQNLELTREIASHFNHKYRTEVFKVPQKKSQSSYSNRIKSLRDPAVKMSKSDQVNVTLLQASCRRFLQKYCKFYLKNGRTALFLQKSCKILGENGRSSKILKETCLIFGTTSIKM